MGAGHRLHNRVRARLARRSGRWLDSEPMTTQRKDRRKKPDRRSGADRRTKQAPVEVELRKGERRRTKLTRRLELETAADQIHAALGLLTRSEEHTSELQSHSDLVCRLLLEKKKKQQVIELEQAPHSLPQVAP